MRIFWNWHVAYVGHKRGNLIAGRVVRQAAPNQILHTIRQPGKNARARQQLRTLGRAASQHHCAGGEISSLASQGIARHKLKAIAVGILNILNEMIQ